MNGSLQDVDVRQLIETYLASIPESNHLKPRLPSSVTALPFTFPEGVVREDVRCVRYLPDHPQAYHGQYLHFFDNHHQPQDRSFPPTESVIWDGVRCNKQS